MMILRHACPFGVEHDRLDGEAPHRVRVELRPISRLEMNSAARERQRRIEQAIVRLEESVELPGIADGRAGDRSLQPALDVAAKAGPQPPLHAAGPDALP